MGILGRIFGRSSTTDSSPRPDDGATAEAELASASPFSFYVDEVFFIARRGVIVTGQVLHGTVRMGGRCFLVREGGFSKATQITGIDAFKKTLNEANTGLYVGLLLRGIQQGEARKGDIVQSSATEPSFDPNAPQCNAVGCHCASRSPTDFCDWHSERSRKGEEFPLKTIPVREPDPTQSAPTANTTSQEFRQVSDVLARFLDEEDESARLQHIITLQAMEEKSLAPLLHEAFAEHGDPTRQNINIYKIRLAVWCGCALHPKAFETYYRTQYRVGRSPRLDEMRGINMKDGMNLQTYVHRLLQKS
jgi:hypothetical protein